MDIKIKHSKNIPLSERLNDYILKRSEKLNYYNSNITSINFHLESEKMDYKVSATLSIKKLGVFKFQTDAKDMYTAVDKIIHKMEKLYLERLDNERKLMTICEYYINNKCHAFPLKYSECYIFSLTCKKYASIQMEVAET